MVAAVAPQAEQLTQSNPDLLVDKIFAYSLGTRSTELLILTKIIT